MNNYETHTTRDNRGTTFWSGSHLRRAFREDVREIRTYSACHGSALAVPMASRECCALLRVPMTRQRGTSLTAASVRARKPNSLDSNVSQCDHERRISRSPMTMTEYFVVHFTVKEMAFQQEAREGCFTRARQAETRHRSADQTTVAQTCWTVQLMQLWHA